MKNEEEPVRLGFIQKKPKSIDTNMNRLEKNRTTLLASLNWMHDSINDFKRVEQNEFIATNFTKEELYEIIRNSVIKSFCVTTSIFRNNLKQYLKKVLKQKHKARSPLSVAQVAYTAHFITDNDMPIFLEMVDDYNRTSHAHETENLNEIFENTCHRAARYHKLMLHYAQKISPKTL